MSKKEKTGAEEVDTNEIDVRALKKQADATSAVVRKLIRRLEDMFAVDLDGDGKVGKSLFALLVAFGLAVSIVSADTVYDLAEGANTKGAVFNVKTDGTGTTLTDATNLTLTVNKLVVSNTITLGTSITTTTMRATAIYGGGITAENGVTGATAVFTTSVTSATVRAASVISGTTTGTTIRAAGLYGGGITSESGVTGATAVFSTSATSATVRAANVYGGTIASEGTVTGSVVRGATVGAGVATVEGTLTGEGTITGLVVRGATVGAGVATVEGTLTGQGTITGSVVRGATVYSGTIMSEGSITGNTVQATVDLSTAGAAAGNVAMTLFATNMPVDCVSTGDAPSWLRVRIIGSTNYFVVPAYQVGSP